MKLNHFTFYIFLCSITVVCFSCKFNTDSKPNADVNIENDNLIMFNESHGNFSFLSIESPDTTIIPQAENGKNYNIYAYTYKYKGYIFSASFYHFPSENKPLGIANEIDVLLDNMVMGAVNGGNGVLVNSIKIKYKNILGKEFLTNYVDGRSISHIFVDNKDVYQLIVESSNNNEDFDNPYVSAFLNSFYKKTTIATQDSTTNTTNNHKKSSEINCTDIEAFMVSNITTIDYNLKSKGWKKIQEVEQADFGKGYQYIIENKNNIKPDQILIYPKVRVVYYFPNNINYKKITIEIKRNYKYSGTQVNFGVKQFVYSNKISKILISPEKEVISFGWGALK